MEHTQASAKSEKPEHTLFMNLKYEIPTAVGRWESEQLLNSFWSFKFSWYADPPKTLILQSAHAHFWNLQSTQTLS